MLTDVIGRPYALLLTPGNVADVTAAPELLARIGRARYLLADKGYDADPLRRALRQAGTVPVIPGRSSRKRKVRYDRERYKGRHLIENAFYRLKDFRRVATRYDKLAANFLSGVAFATALAFWLRLSLEPKDGRAARPRIAAAMSTVRRTWAMRGRMLSIANSCHRARRCRRRRPPR